MALWDQGARHQSRIYTPSIGAGSPKADGQTSAAIETAEAAPLISLVEAAVSVITAWQNNKKINALWLINQNRNAYIGAEGFGWKKLPYNSDSAIMAFSILVAHVLKRDLLYIIMNKAMAWSMEFMSGKWE